MPVAPMAPTISCPSPPTLTRPARAGTDTASAARTIGTARSRIWEIDPGSNSAAWMIALKTPNGSAPWLATTRAKSDRQMT